MFLTSAIDVTGSGVQGVGFEQFGTRMLIGGMTWANRLSSKYFGKHESVDWVNDKYYYMYSYIPLSIFFPLEHF